MGRISGGLWIVGALVGIVGTFLPGASHGDTAWVLALSGLVLAYGIGSVTGLIPWERASMRALAIGMVVTVPVVGLAIYLTGGSISYIQPLLPCSLLYAALFFPARWAWPLSIELILVAGAPLLYDDTRRRKRLRAALHRARRRLPRGHLGDGQPQEPAGARPRRTSARSPTSTR